MRPRGIILSTLITIGSALPACSHQGGQLAKTTTAIVEKAKPTDIFTPAQKGVLKEVQQRGQDCRKKFERCTKPSFICQSERDACAYQTVVDLRI